MPDGWKEICENLRENVPYIRASSEVLGREHALLVALNFLKAEHNFTNEQLAAFQEAVRREVGVVVVSARAFKEATNASKQTQEESQQA